MAHVLKKNLHVISPSIMWVVKLRTSDVVVLCLLTHLAGPITSVLTPVFSLHSHP